MTCCEGWTSCNGFSLLLLLLAGVVLNAIPLIVNVIDEDVPFQNPISCYEWWLPGIIGAGLMAIPATTMSLSARKRGCCNNKTGMFLSSLTNALTIIGAAYCLTVSVQALMVGPLICNPQVNGTVNCQFSLKSLSDIDDDDSLDWFLSDSCISSKAPGNSTAGTTTNSWKPPNLDISSKENKYRTIHFSVFLGLLLVGILELLVALSQIVIGFLGCLCGVSKRRSRVV
ncbi:PREDICTED: transmembrane 4 L6 family member 20 [Chrysochloris asiatica]|uniref:Transmembrane 4 L6 family member 20 n=1 Tax=Chrysochloris asiatica TaxID=185453 RepID=A0A9B0TBG8_CHRAS|nr:PREDICTED: transmembrane 4 L6 family member 20 [Chrysochloris asiatica]